MSSVVGATRVTWFAESAARRPLLVSSTLTQSAMVAVARVDHRRLRYVPSHLVVSHNTHAPLGPRGRRQREHGEHGGEDRHGEGAGVHRGQVPMICPRNTAKEKHEPEAGEAGVSSGAQNGR